MDYDRNKELNKEERKFNESFDLISQHSMKNPLSESEDELDERMNVELDTEHYFEELSDQEEQKTQKRDNGVIKINSIAKNAIRKSSFIADE